MSFVSQYATWKAKLESAVDSTLQAEVKDGMLEALQDSVQKRVYDQYMPSEYERRASGGGLIAEENFKFFPGHMEIGVANITTGNPAYAATEGWDSGDIADSIETGTGYHWRHSRIYHDMPYPRPFMDEGLNDYVSTGKAEADLADGLRSRGFDVT